MTGIAARDAATLPLAADDIVAMLADEATAVDPYPVYDLMRQADPVLWLPGMGRWLVTGHPEVTQLMCHDQVSVNRLLADQSIAWPGGVQPRGLPFLDPPDHTRLRGLVQQAFTMRGVQSLRPRIEALAGEMLDAAAARGEMDLVKDFAGPLPAIAVAYLIGIPPRDHERFRSWVTTVIETIDPVSLRLVSDEGTDERGLLRDYCSEMIERRRAEPQDDLISAMIRAESDGEQLTADEILDMCVVLTIAGVEAATSLIANGMCALLDHQDQLARLRAQPALMKTAVEELLRFDAPVQLAGRIALADFELGGHTIREGQTVGVVLGAANRDPRVFASPQTLDLARHPNPHLAFGRGVHLCIGGPLVRLEGPIALTALITRFPGLRRTGEGQRRHNVHVRGFESLPVSLS